MDDNLVPDELVNLRTELDHAQKREAATRDVLQVISKNRSNEQPVFDRIVELGQKLCASYFSVLVLGREGDDFQRLVASRNVPDVVAQLFHDQQFAMDPSKSITPNAIIEKKVIHIKDMAQSKEYLRGDKRFLPIVDDMGIGTNLFVPLIHDGEGIGALLLARKEVRPYTPDEILLMQTFAEQAVIAIENVHQFRELQTRLEHEAATREILEVISQSRADEAPVFDAILSNAQRLCGAPFGFLDMVTEDGEHLEIMADGTEPFEPFRTGWRWPINSKLLVARSVRERAVLQIEDAALDPLYSQGNEDRVIVVEAGVRTVLTVPLVSDAFGIGSIALFRRELRPFTPDEIALVQTFAEQAVIAIENVRQFKALEALNAELGDRVDEQVGEIERMGRLKRFLPAAVVNTVISQGSEKLLASHRAMLGVLFCDIRGFTAFCETAEPEETIEVLQTYHEEMGALIAEHGAGVDTRAGDGIMVLFNDPLPCEDPAGDALRLGLAMRSRMQGLCKIWKRHGHKLGFGVGISLGYATVGMVGSEGRYDYTASGTAVNLAARLCDKAKDGEILLSPRAYSSVEEEFTADAIGELSLKGIHAPVEAFRVSGEK